MAVLHPVRGTDSAAKALGLPKGERASVVVRHDEHLRGKKVLLPAYHFMEPRGIEETLLGGYVAQIDALHPPAGTCRPCAAATPCSRAATPGLSRPMTRQEPRRRAASGATAEAARQWRAQSGTTPGDFRAAAAPTRP